jgi:hypothetical protein
LALDFCPAENPQNSEWHADKYAPRFDWAIRQVALSILPSEPYRQADIGVTRATGAAARLQSRQEEPRRNPPQLAVLFERCHVSSAHTTSVAEYFFAGTCG